MVKFLPIQKIKDMFARMRHYISLRILNRIQTFFFNAPSVSKHQMNADMQPSLETNFYIILSSCDESFHLLPAQTEKQII
jgi:hypothetical protein